MIAKAQLSKVSIITCFLNVGPFLKEAIESVLTQSFDNWELILIDDGSSDGSTVIAENYSKNFPGKIFYREHPEHRNLGTGFSRNLGISIARGDLIAFLDGDDVWMPGYLEEIIACLSKHQVSMVCQASEYWSSWSAIENKDVRTEVGVEQDRLYHAPELVNKLYPVGTGAAPCICGIIIEKSAVLRCGGFEQSFNGMFDDQSLLIKLYLREKIFISSSSNNRYRQRVNSLVHTSHSKFNYEKDFRKFLIWLEKYMKENHIVNEYLRNYLRFKLFPVNYPVLHRMVRELPVPVKKIVKRILKAET